MPGKKVSKLVRGRIYRGGSLAHFERTSGVRGDRILYVGDHIYGDVTRAKKESAWRTLMIIEELTLEVEAVERRADDIARLHDLEERRYAMLDSLRERQVLSKEIQARLDKTELPTTERVELDAKRLRLRRGIERVRSQIRTVEAEHGDLEREVEHAMHPFWGSPFKAESELSSFGEQVERFACLYTDRVTNLLGYSASHYFRGARHRMAHEL